MNLLRNSASDQLLCCSSNCSSRSRCGGSSCRMSFSVCLNDRSSSPNLSLTEAGMPACVAPSALIQTVSVVS